MKTKLVGMYLAIVLLAFAVALVSPSARAISSTQESLVQLFKWLSPAVGALYVQDLEGDLKYNCTVTAIGKEKGDVIVITAYHCVEKGQAYLVTFDGKRFHGARVWKVPRWEVSAADEKNKRKWGEPEVDMAMFLVDAVDVLAIAVGTTQGIEPGERIIIVGFPLGITKARYEGIIAGRLDKPGYDYHGYLITQIFTSPGSSGTAIVSVRTKKVIGIHVASAQAGRGLPVLFATPIEYQRYLQEVPR